MSLIGDINFDYDSLPDNYNFNFKLFEKTLKEKYKLNVDFSNPKINISKIVSWLINKLFMRGDVNDRIKLLYLKVEHDTSEIYPIYQRTFQVQKLEFHKKFHQGYYSSLGVHLGLSGRFDTRHISAYYYCKTLCIMNELYTVNHLMRVNNKKIWNTISRLLYANYTYARISCNIKYISKSIAVRGTNNRFITGLINNVINAGLALIGVLPSYNILWILETNRLYRQLGSKWILEILDNIRTIYNKKIVNLESIV